MSNEEHQSPSNTLTHCAFRVSLNSRYVSNGPSTHPQCYIYSLSLYALTIPRHQGILSTMVKYKFIYNNEAQAWVIT